VVPLNFSSDHKEGQALLNSCQLYMIENEDSLEIRLSKMGNKITDKGKKQKGNR
jgi:hypothetical protein